MSAKFKLVDPDDFATKSVVQRMEIIRKLRRFPLEQLAMELASALSAERFTSKCLAASPQDALAMMKEKSRQCGIKIDKLLANEERKSKL